MSESKKLFIETESNTSPRDKDRNSFFEEQRKYLLDLTYKNPFLQTVASIGNDKSFVKLHVVDESIEQVFSLFREDQYGIRFKSIPVPLLSDYPEIESEIDRKYQSGLPLTFLEKEKIFKDQYIRNIKAKEHAERIGLCTKFDLSHIPINSYKKKHSDRDLQTLMYEDDLRKVLQKALQEQNLIKREKGYSTLFLCFGSLSWYEGKTSDKLIKSPLILIKIDLDKNGLNAEYHLKTSADFMNNVILQEKIKKTFNIYLPKMSKNENIVKFFEKLNGYLSRDCGRESARWKVEHTISLVRLDFKSLAFYEDLSEESLSLHNDKDNHLVSSLYTAPDDINPRNGSKPTYSESVSRAVCIDGADGSQLDVINKTLAGGNINVQGPPGTGKSQTIVNLISSLIYHGKKVLFMAEKACALDIVKKKLTKKGLDNLVFQISNDKPSIIEGLSRNLNSRHSNLDKQAQEEEQERINKLIKSLEDKYDSYIQSMNETFREFNVHDIFMKVIDSIELVGRLPHDSSINPILNKIDKDRFERYRDSIKGCAERFEQCNHHSEGIRYFFPGNHLKTHPWAFYAGTNNDDFYDYDQIKKEVSRLISELNDLIRGLKFTNDHTSCSIKDISVLLKNYDYIKQQLDSSFLNDLKSHPQPDELIETIEEIKTLCGKLDLSCLKNFSEVKSFLSIVLDLLKVPSLHKIKSCNANEIIGNRKYISSAIQFLSPAKKLLEVGIKVNHLSHNEFLILYKLLSNLPEMVLKNKFDVNKFKLPIFKELVTLYDSVSAIGQRFSMFDLKSIDIKIVDSHKISKVRSMSFFEKMFSSEYRKLKHHLKEHRSSSSYRLNYTGVILFLEQFKMYSNQRFELKEIANNLGIMDLKDIKLYLGTYNILKEYSWAFDILTLLVQQDDEYKKLLNNELFHIDLEDQLQISPISNKTLNIIDDRHKDIICISERLCFLNRTLELNNNIISKIRQLSMQKIIALKNTLSFKKELECLQDKLTVVAECHLDNYDLDEKFIFNVRLFQIFKPDHLVLEDISNLFIAYNRLKKTLDENNFKKFKLLFGNFDNHKIGDINFEVYLIRLDRCADKRNKKYFKAQLRLNEELRKDASNLGILPTIFDLIEEHNIPSNKWGFVWDYVFFSFLSRCLSKDGRYSESVEDLDMKIEEYKKLKLKERDMNSKVILNKVFSKKLPQGTYGIKLKDKTELYLIEHEIDKKKRHIPIRQLTKRAGACIQTMQPICIGSPVDVAIHLHPDSCRFDVLIIDEASQMRPTDALPGMLRSTQIVAIGDLKQMPPSNIFKSSTNGHQDDMENSSAFSSDDSILSSLGYMHRLQLRHHYRSEHESLIKYSNEKFYDNNLILYPSAKVTTEAVEYVRVDGATAVEKNANNVINSTEAGQVVDRAIQYIKENPTHSLGIVAINAGQKGYIEEIYRNKTKDDMRLNKYHKDMKNKEEDIFFKNLENVQGDERDVIIISSTYARDGAGNFRQNFGPISKSGGEKRINVLITRARKKMIVFSSFDPAEITSETMGAKIWKGFLEYAKTKRIKSNPSSSSSETHNPFERSVGEMLQSKGYEVAYQVGESGYFIDIGVKNPNNKSEYLVGIECDGASYHSSYKSRLRDYEREGHLKNLGWKILRVWSSSWFDDKEREIEKLCADIKRLENNTYVKGKVS